MSEKRSIKLCKLRFLRNLRKYRTDLKINDVKTMVIALAPTQAVFYVGATIPKSVKQQKRSNCVFCNTAGASNLKLSMDGSYLKDINDL